LNFDEKVKKPEQVNSSIEPEQVKKNSSFKSIQEIGSSMDQVQISNKNLSKHDSNISKEERKSTKKGTNSSLGIKVGPEIFVSLKKGSLNQYYTLGKTLGEGSKQLFI
jgi:hypothetical protein